MPGSAQKVMFPNGLKGRLLVSCVQAPQKGCLFGLHAIPLKGLQLAVHNPIWKGVAYNSL